MLAPFRRFLNTWIAKFFFFALAAAFLTWGVNDMVSQIGTSGNIATVGGQAITPTEFSVEFNRTLKQAIAKAPGGALSADEKKALGYQTLYGMIYRAALDAEAKREGIAVNNDALRNQIETDKVFLDSTGKFTRTNYLQILSDNNLTTKSYEDGQRDQMLEAEILDSVEVGAGASAILTDHLFGYEAQNRTADVVLVKTADQPAPADPTDAQLQRYYANHLSSYATPEYRKIKLVVLSADTLASSETVTDADAQTYYKANFATYVQPEKRSVRILVFADQAKAQTLAAAWAKNSDWTAIQKQAQAAGGSAVELPDTSKPDFPTPALADAVFAARIGAPIGPVQAGLGWQVAQVTTITPANTVTFETAEPAIKTKLQRAKASVAIYDQANKLEDAIGQSSDLNQVPADIGAAAAEGTVDANGIGLDGTQAPLPASGGARAAILADAFSQTLNQPAEFKQASLKTGADPVFYAMTVEQITPPAHKAYADVATQVRVDWILDQRRHEAETAAAKMLATVQGGVENLSAVANGTTVIHSAPFFSEGTPSGIPSQIVAPMFATNKIGDASMAETNDGFAVAVLTKITTPDRTAAPEDWNKLRTQLEQSMRGDIESTYTDALRSAAKVNINEARLNAAIE